PRHRGKDQLPRTDPGSHRRSPEAAGAGALAMRGQGCLSQRGGAWWIAYYHRGEQIRESVRKARENTKKENTEAAAKRLRKLRQKTAKTPGVVGPALERPPGAELSARVHAPEGVVEPERDPRERLVVAAVERA